MSQNQVPAGHFKILYFASATALTKRTSEDMRAPSSPQKLFQALEEKYPGIQSRVLGSSALTINLEYVDLDEDNEIEIKEGDEVAIIPPVSAG